MAELVYAQVLGTCGETLRGSSPLGGTRFMNFVVALMLVFLTAWLSPRDWKINKIVVERPIPASIPLKQAQLDDGKPWGVAEKVGEHTYSIKVQNDARMGSSEEILNAINDLRIRNGVQILKSDSRLCTYAYERAKYFEAIKSTDEHRGFMDYLNNQDGFEKLGFAILGENSSYGYVMSGVHLVEFVYMQSQEHNKNQLDSRWDRGCVGVYGSATNVLFATSPI